MDAWLLKNIGDNWMTIYLVLTLLKGVAILTPSAADDRIITLLSQVYNHFRSGDAPDKLPE